MKKCIVILALAAGLAGCNYLTITKTEGGDWHATELSLGSNTALADLSCDVTPTNGFHLVIGGVTTDVSTNNAATVESVGSAVGTGIKAASGL